MAENAVRGCSAYQSRCAKAVFRNNMKRETPLCGVSLFMLLRSRWLLRGSLTPLSPFVERCAGETADAGEQQRDPQQHVVAVAGQRRADGLHEADLDGVGRIDVLEGVASGGADALAVDLDVCNGIAVIRRNGEGQILALTDADVAGGRDGAALARDHLDNIVVAAGTAGGRTTGDRQRAIHKDDSIVFVRRSQAAGANDKLAGITRAGDDLISVVVHICQLDRSGQLVVAEQVADGVVRILHGVAQIRSLAAHIGALVQCGDGNGGLFNGHGNAALSCALSNSFNS